MTWNKREPVTNLVILGDDEGQVRKVGGLLASTKQDAAYPSRSNYELVQRNGDSIWLAGSASLGRQLSPHDVGKFVKAEFKGWGKAAQGKFKNIEVLVYEGEPTADMKQWPRWKELQHHNGGQAVPPPVEDDDDSLEDDDDLPF